MLVRPSVRKKLTGLKYEPKKGVLSVKSDIDLFLGIKWDLERSCLFVWNKPEKKWN